jgi:hypothetical protein
VIPFPQTIRRRAPRGRVDNKDAVRRGLIVVVGGFVVSQVAYYAIGIRFDAIALHPRGSSEDLWQLLDTPLLSHDLVQSVWYLHSQPPLFNLYCGILLHLPLGMQQPVAAGCFLILGLLLAGSTYLLLAELHVPPRVSAAVSLVVIANPATILYENWLSWSYPAASVLTAGAYCCARFMKTRRTGWGVGCLTCFAMVVLDDSTYQWVWMVAVMAALFFYMRPMWRQVFLVTAIPLLLVGGWYAKNAVIFGTATTSSWFGMNVASTTIARAPQVQLKQLVLEGHLSPIATKIPFEPVGVYDPQFVHTGTTGIRTLDSRLKSDGATNYNNLAYVAVSNLYLQADLAYIRMYPGAYARNVALSAAVWFIPADQFQLPSNFYAGDGARISGYETLYDAAILWQAHSGVKAEFRAATTGAAPSTGEYSYSTVIEYVLALLVAPFVIIRRRRSRYFAGTLVVLWLTVTYSFLATSLTSLGENMRFQFELGGLPLVLAVAVLASLVRSVQTTRRSNAEETSAPSIGPKARTHASGAPHQHAPTAHDLNRGL